MGRPSAKKRKPYDLDAIVDVAVQVFLQRGYDGASLDQVAEAAGITKASIYYHAEGKEALLARGAGRALEALFAVLEEPAATEGREIDRLKYVVKRTIEITVKRLPEVALLLRVRGNTETERWILEQRRRFDRLVTAMVNKAQMKGEIRVDIEPGLITRLLFG
ncbi:MAG: TetR/AcrR family transcriptional regulator, partial [Deltaproteobacteria bacterium]|nr:TetR/AcrR family transcriptional regulator [Deltaproteobacteria bacterium]